VPRQVVWVADQEEPNADHRANGGHDIARHISNHVLHLQRSLLAVLPALNEYA